MTKYTITEIDDSLEKAEPHILSDIISDIACVFDNGRNPNQKNRIHISTYDNISNTEDKSFAILKHLGRCKELQDLIGRLNLMLEDHIEEVEQIGFKAGIQSEMDI